MTTESNPLTELLRPHFAAIEAAIKEGDASALNIRSLYELYRACPSDPSAPALCKAALNEWLRTRPDPLVVVGDIVERIGKSVIEAAEPGDDTKVAHTCECGSDSVSKEAGCSQCSCGAESYDSDPRKLKPEIPSPERRLVLAELTVGTPVKAPADGLVTLAHPDMYFSGATLIMDHGHGLSSTFLHLDKILVEKGRRVKQGDVVALMGASGRVTGPPSSRTGAAAGRPPTVLPAPGHDRSRLPLGFEGGPDALGPGLGHQAVVLGAVDRLRLVDEHHRDVVADGVAPLEARVVQGLLVLEVEQRALVLGAGQDVEQLRVEGHLRRPRP